MKHLFTFCFNLDTCREKRRRRSNSFGGSSSGGDSYNAEPRGVSGGHNSNMSNGVVQTNKTSSMLRYEYELNFPKNISVQFVGFFTDLEVVKVAALKQLIPR
jgi:hypothetical protein